MSTSGSYDYLSFLNNLSSSVLGISRKLCIFLNFLFLEKPYKEKYAVHLCRKMVPVSSPVCLSCWALTSDEAEQQCGCTDSCCVWQEWAGKTFYEAANTGKTSFYLRARGTHVIRISTVNIFTAITSLSAQVAAGEQVQQYKRTWCTGGAILRQHLAHVTAFVASFELQPNLHMGTVLKETKTPFLKSTWPSSDRKHQSAPPHLNVLVVLSLGLSCGQCLVKKEASKLSKHSFMWRFHIEFHI